MLLSRFYLMLVRIGPTFFGSSQYLDQRMAGLVFLTSLIYLLIFPIVGLVGVTIAGIGLALGYVGTEPVVAKEQGERYVFKFTST